ncbi:MAG: putative succinyldiaminopimelate transaminase DapC [Actinomycetota bacterium]|nr:MAG: putative succinyldiaminopimelate transaminase DapC [Actinomycetota bacterium]
MVGRSPELVARMLPHATSVFGQMSALAARTGAINLGQGYPDTDGPDELKAIACQAISDGRGNQYPPAHGLPQLRDAIAAHQQRWYGLSVDPADGVVVGTGASEILAAALLALLEPGDEVLVFEPWFDIYAAGIALAGGVRVSVPLVAPAFRPDLAALRAAVTARTRLILLNSPHNPTGVVFTAAELTEIARIAVDHDLLVVSDEAYEHLWFDEHRHIPIATLPGMAERTLTVGSGGKSFSFTGWKVGWGSGPADLVGAVRVVRQHLSYVSGGPFQWAMAAGLELPDSYFENLRASLQSRRDLFCDGLTGLGLPVEQPQGTYFVTTDVRPLGYDDGVAFCDELPERAGVAAIPVRVLCDDPEVAATTVRWTFCKRPEVLTTALDRLRAAFG